MLRRTLFAALPLLVSALIGLSLNRDAAAFYGDPRFLPGQPIILNRLLHNVPPAPPQVEDDFLLSDYGGSASKRLDVAVAVGSWNSLLQGTPNNLTKYALHFNAHSDPSPNVNIKVTFVDRATTNTHCKGPNDTYDPPGCNDFGYPITTIWMYNGLSDPDTRRIVKHELGHSVWYDDQYNQYSGSCHVDSQGAPVPDSIMNCAANISATDLNDFLYHYKPAYQSADPTYPATGSSTWSVYYGGNVSAYTNASKVEYAYYWNKWSDTNGSVQSSYSTNLEPPNLLLGYVVGSRYCITAYIYNEVGYASGTGGAVGPRSQFSCIGAAQSQTAGFLLSTSDRTDPSTGTLYLRIKNFTGGSRNVGIFGYPNFNDIGCGYADLANGATRECGVALARGAYDRLAWYAWDSSNNLSWGYLDFE